MATKNIYIHTHAHTQQMSISFWNISHTHSSIPLVLLHRTKYWESSTNCHLDDNIHILYSSFSNKKKCPQRTVQFKLFRTSSKSSKMILCLWHFFSLLLLLLMLYNGNSTCVHIFTAQFVFQVRKLIRIKAKTSTLPTNSFR